MKPLLIGIALGATSALIAAGMGLDISAAPAQAAPQAAGCDYLATIDSAKIYQCADFDGDKFLASTGVFLEYRRAAE